MTESFLPVLGVGLVLGLRHALEPDHVAAVTTLAGQRSRVLDAWRLAAAWAVGHTATIALVASLGIVLGLRLPERFEPWAEALVGATLIALGASVIVRWVRGRWHVHAHAHDGVPHVHVHSHRDATSHAHRHPSANVRWALGIGLLHGLAGSGAVMALLVAMAPTRAAQGLWLATFGAGTVIGMALVSTAVWGALRVGALRGPRWVAALRLGSAAGAMAIGALLVARSFSP